MQFRKFHVLLFIIFLLGISMLTVPSADAQTVHALLVIMDADSSIGKAMEVNQQRIEQLLKSVSRVYPVKKTVYLSSHDTTRTNTVLRWIRSVKPSPNDVVLVYYGGHGAMNKNGETYLQLTDGKLFRSQLANTIRDSNSCRLKLLITDACSNATELATATALGVETVSKVYIKNLFGQHEGFLHVNGATEGEYGYCYIEPKLGGFFTLSLTLLISDLSDENRDGFVEWQEVFDLAKEDTKKHFNQNYPHFPLSWKNDLRIRGITSQTPKAYSLPKRLRHRPPPDRRDPVVSLWELRNPRAKFKVELKTDKPTYRIDDYLTLQINAKENCYIMVLNWDKNGTLNILYPNEYESKNLVRKDRTHTFPTAESAFDFILPGPVGRERFKLIAVRHQTADEKLKAALKDIPREDSSRFRRQAEVILRDKAETKILKELLKLNPSDWSEANTTIFLNR